MKQNDSIQKEDLNEKADIQADAANVDDMTILKNLLEPKEPKGDIQRRLGETDNGQEVKLIDAHECIERFKSTMGEHGIMEAIEGPIPIIGKLRLITESEEFQGENLLKWMIKTVKKYDPVGNGKNMVIRATLASYTGKFLETYLPEKPNLRIKKQDRITIFLVPHHLDDSKVLFDNKDITAYDLGGLKP